MVVVVLLERAKLYTLAMTIYEDPLFGSGWGWLDPKGDLDVWITVKKDEQDKYVTGEDVYSKKLQKTVSKYYVREDLPPYLGTVLVKKGKRTYPFQPFSFILLGSSRTPKPYSKSDKLLKRLRQSIPVEEFARNCIAVGMAHCDYIEVPYTIKSAMYRWEQKRLSDVAKSLFRCTGDLLIRGLYAYKYKEFPYGILPPWITYKIAPVMTARHYNQLTRDLIDLRSHPSPEVYDYITLVQVLSEELISVALDIKMNEVYDFVKECSLTCYGVKARMTYEDLIIQVKS